MQCAKIVSVADRIVVEVGSRLFTNTTGDIDLDSINCIAAALAELCKDGHELVVVTSGAVSAGKEAIALKKQLWTIAEKRAAAAVGQVRLMRAYEAAFISLGQMVAQILITKDDISNRKSIVNARATIDTLLSMGVIPLINENTSVATQEIQFEDHEELSARIADLVEADLLLILTNIAGIYTESKKPFSQSWHPAPLPLRKVIMPAEIMRLAVGSGYFMLPGGNPAQVEIPWSEANKLPVVHKPFILRPGLSLDELEAKNQEVSITAQKVLDGPAPEELKVQVAHNAASGVRPPLNVGETSSDQEQISVRPENVLHPGPVEANLTEKTP